MINRFLISFFIFGYLFTATAAPTENYDAHIAMIKNLGKQAVDSLTSKTISEEERKLRFEKIFNEAFAVKSIARFVLGRYFRIASQPEKAEFFKLFKKTIADIYANKFRNYNNESFTVSHARSLGINSGVRVYSKIMRPGAEPVDVEWKIFTQQNGALKITDVIVEGISMSATQRSEFSSILMQNQGKVSALNAALRQKVNPNQQVLTVA